MRSRFRDFFVLILSGENTSVCVCRERKIRKRRRIANAAVNRNERRHERGDTNESSKFDLRRYLSTTTIFG